MNLLQNLLNRLMQPSFETSSEMSEEQRKQAFLDYLRNQDVNKLTEEAMTNVAIPAGTIAKVGQIPVNEFQNIAAKKVMDKTGQLFGKVKADPNFMKSYLPNSVQNNLQSEVKRSVLLDKLKDFK